MNQWNDNVVLLNCKRTNGMIMFLHLIVKNHWNDNFPLLNCKRTF